MEKVVSNFVFIGQLALTDRLLSLFSSEHSCQTAADAKEGFALYQFVKMNKPIVICDTNLAGISGLEFCRAIKEDDQKIFVVLLSQYNDSKSRLKGLQAGADGYIDQSISDQELKLLIENISRTLATSKDAMEIAPRKNHSKGSISDLTDRVRSLVLSHYDTPLRMREMDGGKSRYVAKRLDKSYRTFQREIKAETGKSFKQLQLIIRLEKAKSLFDNGCNINQVTDLLSFSSPAHLSRAFKAEFGLTPSKYKSMELTTQAQRYTVPE